MSKYYVKAMIRVPLYTIMEAGTAAEAAEMSEKAGVIWLDGGVQDAYFGEGDNIYEVIKEE